jgi:starch phosphorylase
LNTPVTIPLPLVDERLVAKLWELAKNPWWTTQPKVADLFARIDPDLWSATHSPVQVLMAAGDDRLGELLLGSPGVRTDLEHLWLELQAELTRSTWWARHGDPRAHYVYLTPEIGLTHAIPGYSGGLGVLAGDTVKAMSDVGVPVTAFTLYYAQGYFSQSFSYGEQLAEYVGHTPEELGLTLHSSGGQPTIIRLQLAGEPLDVQLWYTDVGRVRVYFMDTHLASNRPELQAITDHLYGGDSEYRLQQEYLLGVGAVAAMRALGIEPTVVHLNDPHAAFAGLEMIREQVVLHDVPLDLAIDNVRSLTVFTTHTPVPAGMDRFGHDLMKRYWRQWCVDVGMPMSDLMHAGLFNDEQCFNMAALGVNIAGQVNGVSRLHGMVSRELFAGTTPHAGEIGSVTNGIHGPTWVSNRMRAVLTEHIGPDWHLAGPDAWQGLHSIAPSALWNILQGQQTDLVGFVRRYLRSQCQRQGWNPADLGWTDSVLEPGVLTIGFARRVALYKRLLLLLSNPDRLRALLLDADRPIQFVFAGKAHPKDEEAKRALRRFMEFVLATDVRHRIVFLPDYNMDVAHEIVAGCHVWLNNPEFGREASGTSGMKVVLAGGIQLTVPDGWAYELCTPENSWLIGPAEPQPDEAVAEQLYQLLEGPVRHLYYDDRDAHGVPGLWVAKALRALTEIGPQVQASRMVLDYLGGPYRVRTLAAA